MVFSILDNHIHENKKLKIGYSVLNTSRLILHYSSKMSAEGITALVEVMTKLINESTVALGDRICSHIDRKCNEIVAKHDAEGRLAETNNQELLQKLGAMKAQVGDMIKSNTGAKRAPKTTGGKAATTAAGGAKFPANRMFWFKTEYASNEEFRTMVLETLEKVTGYEGVRAELAGDAKVQKKNEGEERYRAEAGILWAKITKEAAKIDKSLDEKISSLHTAAKTDFTKNNAPPEVNTEAVTP